MWKAGPFTGNSTLWDKGYAQTPEDRIGMLFWRMHRCARIIVSLKFHLGQMKPREMVDFLVQRVGHEKLGATSEVRRFIGSGYSPQYQCGYLLGGMQLRALHDEMVGAGRMNDLQFNDSVLGYGPIPIELIRDGMLNTPLTRDTRASWRFAGEPPVAGETKGSLISHALNHHRLRLGMADFQQPFRTACRLEEVTLFTIQILGSL